MKSKISPPLLAICMVAITLNACVDADQYGASTNKSRAPSSPGERELPPEENRTTTTAAAEQMIDSGANCGRRSGRAPKLLYDYRTGVDLSFYQKVHGVSRFYMTGQPADTQRKLQVRDAAYNDAFTSIDHLGISYSQAQSFYFEGYRQLRAQNDRSILRRDIKLYTELETYDYDKCEYIYEVVLAVPRFPTLGAELDAHIEQIATQYIEGLRQQYEKTDLLSIKLDALLKQISSDHEVRQAILRYLEDEKFRNDLKYKDDDTQRFMASFSGDSFQIPNYEVGQYSVNALIGSIIRKSVIPAVRSLLDEYRRVDVLCIGHTDQLRVRKPIEYIGKARLGEADERFPFESEPLETVQLRTISSNVDLSFARAYEGIAAVSIGLGLQNKHPRLALFYTGRGEIPSAREERPESRKIIFEIHFYDRY